MRPHTYRQRSLSGHCHSGLPSYLLLLPVHAVQHYSTATAASQPAGAMSARPPAPHVHPASSARPPVGADIGSALAVTDAPASMTVVASRGQQPRQTVASTWLRRIVTAPTRSRLTSQPPLTSTAALMAVPAALTPGGNSLGKHRHRRTRRVPSPQAGSCMRAGCLLTVTRCMHVAGIMAGWRPHSACPIST